MAARTAKPRYSAKDHLTAYLVLVVILAVVAIGAFTLYMTGVFEPVEEGIPLAEAEPMEFATRPPARGLAGWLFTSASAEGETGEISPDAPTEEAAPQSEDELEVLLAEIVAEENGEEEIDEADRIDVSKGDLAINANLPDTVYNVLLLATDSRDMTASTGRTDVMIIASINKVSNEIKLVSLSRDMYLTIPGGVTNKINAAHAYGGPLLAVKTVNSNFEMNIHDYAVVNFSMMASIVDALGGVDIYLEPMEYYYINYNVAVSEDYEGFAKSTARKTLTEADQETVVHLDGLQGVAYARIRKMDNDFQRGSRQRILLQAMMDKGLTNLSLSTFYSLATSVMNSMSTNVDLTTVIDLGTWLLSADSVSMSELSIPVQGSYHSGHEKDMDVILINQQQNVVALHEFLYGEYIPAGAQAQ